MNQKLNFLAQSSVLFGFALLIGLFTGTFHTPLIITVASTVSEIFINLLKLVSLPIVFLSIISTASGMDSIDEMRVLGRKVVKYTILTTLIAATIALTVFLAVNPVGIHQPLDEATKISLGDKGYLTYLINIVPSNIIQPFAENNVIGVLFLAMLLSFAILALPNDNRQVLHTFFKSLYAAIMKITTWIVRLMPIAIWAFITLFLRDLGEGLDWKPVAGYLACVLIANLIQAVVVLPIFLRMKGLDPLRMARAMYPALSVAFFSKSSSAALPAAMKCAESRAGVTPKIAGFTLPLCTTINMNACAAFILTTVLFISMSQGVTYTTAELFVWIFVATIAAVGNAGVPMGCFFLSSAFLAAMNVPLHMLGVILPFYSLIDMLESAINVWSDSCVTMVVNREVVGTEENEMIVKAGA